jgi:hypothetical protein
MKRYPAIHVTVPTIKNLLSIHDEDLGYLFRSAMLAALHGENNTPCDQALTAHYRAILADTASAVTAEKREVA